MKRLVVPCILLIFTITLNACTSGNDHITRQDNTISTNTRGENKYLPQKNPLGIAGPIIPEQKLTGEKSNKTGLKYLLSLPKGYNSNPAKKWPLILFLHGSGDRGDDLKLVRRSGITKIAEKDGLKFIAVYPQCPPDKKWKDMTKQLSDLLDELSASLRADKDRIYLTGFSLGGYGTWYMALEYPDRFAAIAPVCGSIYNRDLNAENAGRIKNIPVWAFHGALDQVVPMDNEKEFIELIKKAGGKVKYTIYDDLGHKVWAQTYNHTGLYDWLLKQRKFGEYEKNVD